MHATHLSGNIACFHFLDHRAVHNVINNILWDIGPVQQAPREKTETRRICTVQAKALPQALKDPSATSLAGEHGNDGAVAARGPKEMLCAWIFNDKCH